MYPKVQVLATYEDCDGEAYVFDRLDTDAGGKPYKRYKPCVGCNGTGKATQWISLSDFADLVERATSMEPDWQMLSKQKPVSQYQDSRDAAGI